MSTEPEIPRVPEGWQLVPIEATEEMATDDGVDVGERTARRVWYFMVRAAPSAPPDDCLAALDASWRATLVKERTIHLNEVRLKDEYRTRMLAAEAELAKLREANG